MIGPAVLPFNVHALSAGLNFDAVDVNLSQRRGAQVGTVAARLCLASPCFQTRSVTIWQRADSWFGNSGYQEDTAPQPELAGLSKNHGAGHTSDGERVRGPDLDQRARRDDHLQLRQREGDDLGGRHGVPRPGRGQRAACILPIAVLVRGEPGVPWTTDIIR